MRIYMCIYYGKEVKGMHRLRSKRWACMFLSLFFVVSVCTATLAALWPDMNSTGGRKKDGSLDVVTEHAKDGYVLVRGGKSKKRLKLRVRQGEHSVMYDLGTKNEYEVIPLQFGNGKYQFNLYKQVSGSRYSEDGVVSFKVEMTDVNHAFLYPNQFINYNDENLAVQKANELCRGVESTAEKYEILSEYILRSFVYDYVRAVTTKAEAFPDVDYCFKNGMGICQDLAATSVCMFRTQGIPAKLVIGSANGQYHAWVQVTLDGEEKLFDPTAILQNMPKSTKYAVERWY